MPQFIKSSFKTFPKETFTKTVRKLELEAIDKNLVYSEEIVRVMRPRYLTPHMWFSSYFIMLGLYMR